VVAVVRLGRATDAPVPVGEDLADVRRLAVSVVVQESKDAAAPLRHVVVADPVDPGRAFAVVADRRRLAVNVVVQHPKVAAAPLRRVVVADPVDPDRTFTVAAESRRIEVVVVQAEPDPALAVTGAKWNPTNRRPMWGTLPSQAMKLRLIRISNPSYIPLARYVISCRSPKRAWPTRILFLFARCQLHNLGGLGQLTLAARRFLHKSDTALRAAEIIEADCRTSNRDGTLDMQCQRVTLTFSGLTTGADVVGNAKFHVWRLMMAVRGIRGATTVDADIPEQILAATRELLEEILRANQIEQFDEIASAVFTTTTDLTSTFPAEAARELGMDQVPLLCAGEISVPGSTPRCIRLLIQLNTQKSQAEMRHVYLRDAKKLRPDINKPN